MNKLTRDAMGLAKYSIEEGQEMVAIVLNLLAVAASGTLLASALKPYIESH